MTNKIYNWDTMSQVLTVEDVSLCLNENKATIRSLIRSGELKATKIGRRYFVNKDYLRSLFEEPAPDTEGAINYNGVS